MVDEGEGAAWGQTRWRRGGRPRGGTTGRCALRAARDRRDGALSRGGAERTCRGTGQVWIDDLQLEEIALVNVLRRPGTPLSERGEASGAVYVEGRDFRYIADPLMDFHFDHPSPTIQILPGGAIHEGERLRIGFYHRVFLYNDQVPLCLSEPKAYELWNERVRTMEALLAPRAYFLNADEHRALGTCQACKRSGQTLGEIQADSLTRQYRMIRELNPQAGR